MSDNEIIRISEQAGNEWGSTLKRDQDYLLNFAKMLLALENEACAQIIEQYCGAWDDSGYALLQAIRARMK